MLSKKNYLDLISRFVVNTGEVIVENKSYLSGYDKLTTSFNITNEVINDIKHNVHFSPINSMIEFAMAECLGEYIFEKLLPNSKTKSFTERIIKINNLNAGYKLSLEEHLGEEAEGYDILLFGDIGNIYESKVFNSLDFKSDLDKPILFSDINHIGYIGNKKVFWFNIHMTNVEDKNSLMMGFYKDFKIFLPEDFIHIKGELSYFDSKPDQTLIEIFHKLNLDILNDTFYTLD